MHMSYMYHTLENQVTSSRYRRDRPVCLEEAQILHLADPPGVDQSQSFTTTFTFTVQAVQYVD